MVKHPKPERECPRWQTCSVNNCPLSEEQFKSHPLDKQRKCPMERTVRERIAAKYPDLLPKRGLTAREMQGDRVWASFDDVKRKMIAEQGKLALNAINSDSKGKTGKTDQETAS